MHLHFGAYHDYRTAGIVDAFTQQVLTETSLLAFQHIGQGFQRPVAGSHNGTAAAAVIDQGVYSFLQHTFFITYNDVRRMQFQQPFQPVVTVNDTAIQVIQITGGKTSAIKLYHRTQVRRDDRNHIQNHPGRLIAGFFECFRNFQTAYNTYFLLAGRLFQFFPKLSNQSWNIYFFQQLFDSRGSHLRAECISVLRTVAHVFCFR